MAEERPPSLRPFLEVQQEVRRLFQELVRQPWGVQEPSQAVGWQPRCNMEETDEAIIVEVELPGVTRDNVHLSVEGDVLHISGERHATSQRQEHNYHYFEQQYGRFERQLRLPRSINREQITAEFNNGILSITLPKEPAQLPQNDSARKDV
jgi:HSP20 family protein